MSERKPATRIEIIRTIVGCLIALGAAAWAFKSGEITGWFIALVGAGVIEPAAIRDFFVRPQVVAKTLPPDDDDT